MSAAGGRVCVAAVAGAKGVRGALRLKTFTEDPASVGSFSALWDEAGRPVRLTVVEPRNGAVVACIDGVESRNAAEALKGVRLYVDRADLPPPREDEFYHADLIGLAASLPCGRALGRVSAVWDHGAGAVIEIAGENGELLLPFTREAVPEVAVAEGRVTVDPPPGLPGLESPGAAA